jgi:hypothetical protein
MRPVQWETEGDEIMIYGGTKRLLVAVAVLCLAALSWAGAASSALTGQPTVLLLTPPAAANPVGAPHCVTATVLDEFGNPLEGVNVMFTVTSVGPDTNPTPLSPSVGVTDANGQTQFCFTSSSPGIDDIHAVVGGGVAAPTTLGTPTGGNPQADAFKLFFPAQSTALCSALVTNGGWITDAFLTKANFGGNAQTDASALPSGDEEFQTSFNLHSIQILAITCDPSHTTAQIWGTATEDGTGTHVFVITETDGDKLTTESGALPDTYGIIVDDYMSGQQPLGGGDIEVH